MKEQRVITFYHDATGSLTSFNLDAVIAPLAAEGWHIISVTTVSFNKYGAVGSPQIPVLAITLLIEKL